MLEMLTEVILEQSNTTIFFKADGTCSDHASKHCKYTPKAGWHQFGVGVRIIKLFFDNVQIIKLLYLYGLWADPAMDCRDTAFQSGGNQHRVCLLQSDPAFFPN
jgi:hypothetical protein